MARKELLAIRCALVAALLALGAECGAVEPAIQLTQATDPLLAQTLQDIAKYEGLADKLLPGDVATANRYIGELRAVGSRLRSVRIQTPDLQDAVKRYNALNQRIVALAREAPQTATPQPSAQPPAGAAAPTLTSSDQARLNRLGRGVQSLAQQVESAPFQTFLDAQEVVKLRNAIASQRDEAAGLPAHPDVARIAAQAEATAARIDARIAEARDKNAAVGDADAQLAAMEERSKANRVPGQNEFKPDAGPQAAAAFAQTLVQMKAQAESDKSTLDKIEAAGFKNQKIGSLRHWAVAEKLRSIDESRASALRNMDAFVERFMEAVRFHAATDANNEDHRANRLLGAGKYQETLGGFKAGMAAVESAKAFDGALQRQGGPDRAAQAKMLNEAAGSFDEKYRTALAASRMPKPGMTDEKLIAVAKQVLANPNYKDINPALRVVINSQRVTRHEKKEAEIRPGTVTTTATIYEWQWDEFQVATAEKMGDETYVFYNTIKYFYKGAPTTPLDRWLLSGRFQGQKILAENIDK